MAKGSNNKLTKIKSVLKKMQSFKLGSGRAASPPSAISDADDHRLHPVYVGKSRRRYLVTSEVMENPLFRELVITEDNYDGAIIVGCEVVMFEHMLWMMENSNDDDDDPHQHESLDELVQYYANC